MYKNILLLKDLAQLPRFICTLCIFFKYLVYYCDSNSSILYIQYIVLLTAETTNNHVFINNLPPAALYRYKSRNHVYISE